MTDAKQARFEAFLVASSEDERDWIAFCQFERTVDEILDCASMVNPYDDGERFGRERAGMRVAVWTMLHKLLPRVGLGEILSNPEPIGHGIRFGVISPEPNALDHIDGLDAFNAFLESADAAYEAHHGARSDEAMKRLETTKRKLRSVKRKRKR